MADGNLLREWLAHSRWRRWLTPRDLLASSQPEGELFTAKAERITTQRVNVSVKHREKKLRKSEAEEYPTRLPERPILSVRRTVRWFTDQAEITCPMCFGKQQTSCPRQRLVRCPSPVHWSPSGMQTYRTKETVRDAKGDIVGSRTLKTKGPCARCGGRSSWYEICPRCNGNGFVDCYKCRGDGRLIRGTLVIEKHTPSTSVEYRLPPSAKQKWFRRLKGASATQLHRGPDLKPQRHLEQFFYESFPYSRMEYSYRGKLFTIHRTDSDKRTRYIAQGYPKNWLRIVLLVCLGLAALAAITMAAVANA